MLSRLSRAEAVGPATRRPAWLAGDIGELYVVHDDEAIEESGEDWGSARWWFQAEGHPAR